MDDFLFHSMLAYVDSSGVAGGGVKALRFVGSFDIYLQCAKPLLSGAIQKRSLGWMGVAY